MVDIPLIIFIALNAIAHMLISLMTNTNALRTCGKLTIYYDYTHPAMKPQRKQRQDKEKDNMQNKFWQRKEKFLV